MGLAIGIGGLWLSSLYLYVNYRKRRTVPPWARRLALVSIITIPILMAAGFFGWKYYQSRPSDDIIILVADFEGPEPQNYRVAETIIEQLREATKEYDDVQVQTLGEPITAHQGSKHARTKGQEHKASIVLWGWYGKTEEKALVTTHFEVLRGSSYLSLRKEHETLSLAVAQLDTFEIQTRLSSEMSYLTLLTVGLARYEAEDDDAAIILFTDALSLPAVPEQMIEPTAIYFYRGNAYTFKRDYDQAIADYSRAIFLQPGIITAYGNRGIAYYNKGDYAHAISDYDLAIQLKPDDADAYCNRGLVFSKTGPPDSVASNYRRALDFDPNHAGAMNNLAWYFAQRNEHLDEALEISKRSIQLKPEQPYYWGTLAEIYYRSGRFSEAKSANDNARKYAKDKALINSIEERVQKIETKVQEVAQK